MCACSAPWQQLEHTRCSWLLFVMLSFVYNFCVDSVCCLTLCSFVLFGFVGVCSPRHRFYLLCFIQLEIGLLATQPSSNDIQHRNLRAPNFQGPIEMEFRKDVSLDTILKLLDMKWVRLYIQQSKIRL